MKLFSFFILSFLLNGCAQPKYVQSTPPPANPNRPSGVTADCRISFPKSGLCLTFFWEKFLTADEPGVLIVRTFRPNRFDGTPVAQDVLDELTLEPWMPGMNHGSTPTRTERLDTGTFRIHDVFLIMPGDWELRFQQRQNRNLVDEVSIPFVF